jgi:hypothetical protein
MKLKRNSPQSPSSTKETQIRGVRVDSPLITILLNVRTLSVVEVFCHLDYCSKFFEKSSKFFEKSSTTYYLKLLNFGIILS